MTYRRRPVRSATVEVVIQRNSARIRTDGATPERMAKGDVRIVQRLDANGHLTYVHRSVTQGLVEQLSLAGELGENVPRLLAASEWFIEQGEIAELRGRLVRSQLVRQVEDPGALKADVAAARSNLVKSYDWIGVDAFNALYDALIWEILPRGPDRRALFRSALHALARALNAKNPPIE
jgi:hypothetical protein